MKRIKNEFENTTIENNEEVMHPKVWGANEKVKIPKIKKFHKACLGSHKDQ